MQCLAIRRQGIHFDILHCLVLDVVFGSGIALYFMKYFDITLFGIIWYLVRVFHFMVFHCMVLHCISWDCIACLAIRRLRDPFRPRAT